MYNCILSKKLLHYQFIIEKVRKTAMSKSIVRKTDKKCVLCKHWNGAVGSTTITAKPGNIFQFEQTEKKSCFLKGFEMPAWGYCTKFEPRY